MSASSELSDRPTQVDEVDVWTEYLRAAQRLDAVRRENASAAEEWARNAQDTRAALTAVQAQLSAQRSRLRAHGVPEHVLEPSVSEVSVAAATMVGAPAAVSASLDQVREAIAAVDAVVSQSGRPGWSSWSTVWRPWLPVLLIYAVLACAILTTLACVGFGTYWLSR